MKVTNINNIVDKLRLILSFDFQITNGIRIMAVILRTINRLSGHNIVLFFFKKFCRIYNLN